MGAGGQIYQNLWKNDYEANLKVVIKLYEVNEKGK